MLGRAGFELTPVVPRLESLLSARESSARRRLGIPSGPELLFSPFQSLSVHDIQAIFPSEKAALIDTQEGATISSSNTVGRGSRDHLFVAPILVPAVRRG